ncbi:helix-turn-helix transcriptional regulator [Serratia sp. UGAL515B_01]|uniref:helix-turn-helix transcriptional regulator n=1 Tax=Serratia sp. UGAL515B_01 TaxID=2986763 RepID=UPI0029542CB9|nr:LuxR C-terminal-related transcriptional regulator [Serratia sp. UGAL515B_01]WON75516.1 LuxR C-terminal-related transcriptional regulator [Serratia sp. UGAL515B_01]
MIRLIKGMPVVELKPVFPELTEIQLNYLCMFMNYGSYSKIAAIMGCSEDNVKRHIQRCKEKLGLSSVDMLGIVYNARVQCCIMQHLKIHAGLVKQTSQRNAH